MLNDYKCQNSEDCFSIVAEEMVKTRSSDNPQPNERVKNK
jgi:hypothetical protein